ncbi:MAG: nucleotidyltransferase domain-containing protein [Candidatus Sericytochromatia bacterium]|nr:nucleotidyltransferase domain-containing protein [Candidatus Sericytochromatia bacterium]
MAAHHPAAACVFVAGSRRRGEATPHSDLDLVVIYPHLPAAWRESLIFEGQPVEAFVHDPQTLRYFFEAVDRPGGVPSLIRMVAEGLPLPGPSPLSESLQQLACEILAAGPPLWTSAEREAARYAVSDSLDDLRSPRSRAEQLASASRLYGQLATYYLRSQGHWDAHGKGIPRQLQALNPKAAAAFEAAFEALFAQGELAPLLALCETWLAPDGGLLFDGFRREAPPDWRQLPDS